MRQVVLRDRSDERSLFVNDERSLFIDNKEGDVAIVASALGNFTNLYEVTPDGVYDPYSFLIASREKIIGKIQENGNSKAMIHLILIMKKINPATGVVTEKEGHFWSKSEVILAGSNLEETYNMMMAKVLDSVSKYQKEGSGWTVGSVVSLQLHLTKYLPLKGSSYVDLPKPLMEKKAIVNVQNKDQSCFKWSVTRALFPCKHHQERITKDLKSDSEKLDWSGIRFPTEMKDVDRFESLNKVSINVFGYDLIAKGSQPITVRRSLLPDPKSITFTVHTNVK